jgi:hypothetical protein
MSDLLELLGRAKTYDLAQPYFIGMPHHVFPNDLNGYAGMNETFKGRFGYNPPVRTTIAAAGGYRGIRWSRST